MTLLRRVTPNRHLAVLSPVADGVAALRVDASADKARVSSLVRRDAQPSSADLYARLAAEAEIETTPLIALLGQDYYQTVVIEAPSVPADELNWAVRWQVKDYLNFSADELVLDYMPVPAGPGRPESLFVVAAQSPAVRELARNCQGAGLALNVIEVAESAQHHLAQRLASKDQALALLHYDGRSGLLTISFGEHLVLSRRIEYRGMGLGSPLDTVCSEVQRSLDYFDRQYSWLPLAGLLVSPGPDSSALTAQLRDYLSVGVEVLDLAQSFDFSAVPSLGEPASQNAVFHLLGASLRSMA